MFRPDSRGRGQPFSPNSRGLSPQQRHWNPHGSPRFHQQFVPHFNTSTPRLDYRSPSPQHSGYRQRFPPGGPHSDPRNRQSRNSLGSSPNFRQNFRFRHPSEGSGHRGGRYQFSRTDRNSNPGGCDDIRMYYHPSMTENPWQNLKPVPVKKESFTTT